MLLLSPILVSLYYSALLTSLKCKFLNRSVAILEFSLALPGNPALHCFVRFEDFFVWNTTVHITAFRVLSGADARPCVSLLRAPLSLAQFFPLSSLAGLGVALLVLHCVLQRSLIRIERRSIDLPLQTF